MCARQMSVVALLIGVEKGSEAIISKGSKRSYPFSASSAHSAADQNPQLSEISLQCQTATAGEGTCAA